MFLCCINLPNSIFVLIFLLPSFFLVGPNIHLSIFLSNTENKAFYANKALFQNKLVSRRFKLKTAQHYFYVIFITLFFFFWYGCGISSLLVRAGGDDDNQLHLCNLRVNLPTAFTLECDTHRNYYHNCMYQLP